MKYILPVERAKVIRASRTESETHAIWKHAIDLVVPEGTPVYAVAEGIVLDVKSDSDVGGGCTEL